MEIRKGSRQEAKELQPGINRQNSKGALPEVTRGPHQGREICYGPQLA